MATATAKAPAKPAPVKDEKYPVEYIDLHKISANSAQSRGTGALSNLTALGWGMFQRIEAEKAPIWQLLMHDEAPERQQAAALLAENEGKIIETATSLAEHGQEQPIAVAKLKDGTYDVMWGMQRCIARAYNWITGKGPCTVRAEIHPESELKDALLAKIRSRAENRARKAENPIDVAMYYQELRKEFKLSKKEIAERDDCSEQQVTDHLSLLDDALADKRVALMTGEMPVYKALDRLRRLKEGNSQADRDPNDTRQRGRFPSVKVITKAYGSGIKPKKMDDELWELCKLDEVRKFIAKSLGLKFTPYKAPTKKALAEADSTNGTPATADGKKGKKPFTIPRALADKTLIALGLTNARTFSEETVISKLENIVGLGEPDTKLESKGAQNLFDKLMAAYKGGYTVKIKG